MIDMDKMIEIVGGAILAQEYESITQPRIAVGFLKEMRPDEYIKAKKKARAAIKAFCKELPAIDEDALVSESKIIRNVERIQIIDKYKTLLEYGKDA